MINSNRLLKRPSLMMPFLLQYFLGVITTPGMVTISLTVLWDRQTKAAAIISPIVGLACGLATWISTSWYYGNGVIDVTTTGALIPCMYGNIASAFVPMILSPLISLVFPGEPFSWDRFNAIKLISDSDSAQSSLEKDVDTFTPEQIAYMDRTSKITGGLGALFFLGLWVIWPFGMYGAYYEFSLPFFRGWVVVAIIWIFAALLIVTFMPPIEGRRSIYSTLVGQKKSLSRSAAYDVRGVAPDDKGKQELPDSPTERSGERTPVDATDLEKPKENAA